MHSWLKAAALGLALATALGTGANAQLLISGNDEKQTWDEAGKPIFLPAGKDTVSIIDIKDPTKPRIVANLPLKNSVTGPPVNVAISPDQSVALVADSLQMVQDNGAWKPQPDNKVYVIDLKASPPKQAATLELGKQPSGLAFNKAGNLALVTNRADGTLSVLSVSGSEVKVVDTVTIGTPADQLSAVAITPDGKRALVTKFAAHKVALLDIDGQKVTYTKYDMNTGLWPYNVKITSDGKLGLAGNNGGAGSSDGQIDTVAVIDLDAKPRPRVIDQVVVGDGPEGLAVSPVGGWAASVILNGSNAGKDVQFPHGRSYVSLLKIEGNKVRRVSTVGVGNLAEGVAFSPDGKYLYVGNYMDRDMTILELSGNRLKRVGTLKLPGQPASLRGNSQ
ncbi:MAG TPA: YncE family protein [Alphaproteobacteria bacterium]|nr:YncE family protein [Alphaproteobacteria bacterium]